LRSFQSFRSRGSRSSVPTTSGYEATMRCGAFWWRAYRDRRLHSHHLLRTRRRRSTRIDDLHRPQRRHRRRARPEPARRRVHLPEQPHVDVDRRLPAASAQPVTERSNVLDGPLLREGVSKPVGSLTLSGRVECNEPDARPKDHASVSAASDVVAFGCGA